MTERERAICDKYIRLRGLAVDEPGDEPGEFATLRLVVGHQEFVFNDMPMRMLPPLTVEECCWSGEQLAKALARLIDCESTAATPRKDA